MSYTTSTSVDGQLSALHACIDSLAESHDTHDLLERLPHLLNNHFSIEQTHLLLIGPGSRSLYQLKAAETATVTASAVLPGNGEELYGDRQNTIDHDVTSLSETATYLSKRQLEEKETNSSADAIGKHLTLPILLNGRLLGLLQVMSPANCPFTFEEEKSLAILAHYLALRLPSTDTVTSTGCSVVRHYTDDNTIFIDENYLIKGVAGAILWKLVCEYRDHQRSEFCNRELRRDPALGLPEVLENLESRLILLQRRLKERCPFLAIEKTGRGRFRLRVDRSLKLNEV